MAAHNHVYRTHDATPVVAPIYEFQEYPKWVHPEGAPKAVIVHDADEEARVLAPNKLQAPAVDERAALLALAKDHHVPADGRWSLPKIRDALAAAKVAVP